MFRLHVIAGLAVLIASTGAHAQSECGSLENGYGPFDYRTATQKQRETVERYHFTPNVERLKKGQSTVRIGGDISYTLRAFPNHPRALAAMADLSRREKADPPSGSQYTIQCWFERAMTFKPDDAGVRIVYGISLLKAGHRNAAIEQLERADKMLPNNASVHYNLGLAYLDAKDYDKSLVHAKRAYELGFPLPGLRDRLKQAGKWQ